MDPFRIGGDALWILALALMAGASRQALSRTKPGARAPLFRFRVDRWTAFCAVPAAAFAASVWLAYASRTPALGGDLGAILFGVRALAASLFALLHLRTLTKSLAVLAREGQLKP